MFEDDHYHGHKPTQIINTNIVLPAEFDRVIARVFVETMEVTG